MDVVLTNAHQTFNMFPHPMSLTFHIFQDQVDRFSLSLERISSHLYTTAEVEVEQKTERRRSWKALQPQGLENTSETQLISQLRKEIGDAEDVRRTCERMLSYLRDQSQWLQHMSASTEQQKDRQVITNVLENKLNVISASLAELPGTESLKWRLRARHDEVSLIVDYR